ncbi:MAG: MFS transporter [Nitrospinota bacterium]
MRNRWVIAFAAAIVTMVGFGSRGVFGVFYVQMLEEFRWDRAALAGVYSLGLLIMGAGGTLAGALSRRLGARRFYLLSGLLVGLSYFLASRVQTLVHVYLTWGVLGGLGLAALGLAPAQGLVARWFATRRGLAIGIVGAGTGGGNLLLAPLAQFLIERFGWRGGLVAFALISIVVVAIVGAVLMREPPQEAVPEPATGAAVPQSRETAPGGGVSSPAPGFEWTLRSALRTSPIWTISLAWVFLATSIHFVGTHFVALIVGIGHPALLASSVLAVSGVLSVVTRVVGGGLSDRFGRVKTFVSGSGLAALGVAALFFHRTPGTLWDLYAFAILFGTGIGAMTGLTTALGSDMYRGRHFGTILGFMTIGFGVGGALGPWLGGFLFEWTGSYRAMLAYVFLALCCASLFFSSAGRAIGKHESRGLENHRVEGPAV